MEVLRLVAHTHSWAGAIGGAALFWIFLAPRDCQTTYTPSGSLQTCQGVIDLGFQWTPTTLVSAFIGSIVIGASLWLLGMSFYRGSVK